MEQQEVHPDRQRLVGVTLDTNSIGRNNAEVDHEREIAIFDLLEANSFALEESEKGGPYTLHLSLVDSRLMLTVGDQDREPITNVSLARSVPPHREGLFSDVRELLPGDQDAAAVSHRGDRRRPTWSA